MDTYTHTKVYGSLAEDVDSGPVALLPEIASSPCNEGPWRATRAYLQADQPSTSAWKVESAVASFTAVAVGLADYEAPWAAASTSLGPKSY